MGAQAFWNVIGNYNQSTLIWQWVITLIVIVSFILAWYEKTTWLLQVALAIGNMFIGVVFFLIFGTEPIQIYFAAPLFLVIGSMFIYEAIQYKSCRFRKPGAIQWALLCMILVYPLLSLFLGRSFPQTVVYIMPCLFISLSIVIYSCYSYKNKLLLLLMTIWGLTGVKAFFVNALEDVILIVCGLFCLWLLIKERKDKRT